MAIKDATVLVTGGAGFIGTALTRRLVEANRVRILDNLRRDALSASGLAGHPNLELVRGDVRERCVVDEAVEDVDYVVHMASLAGVDTVLAHPVETMEVAIEGTMNVLRACVGRSRIRRVVDLSTSEVFGSYAFRVQEGDVTSLGAVGEARWTYAVSKLATEHLAHNYWKQHGLPTCSIRPFNVYGPGQVGEGAIHAFVVRALAGEPLRIHNEGDQIRAWCFIDDVVEALVRTLEQEAAVGEAFNVGNPRSAITIYQLARLIVGLTGSRSPLETVEWRFPDVELRIPDVRKAERLLGFRAVVDLEDGLKRTIDWYRRAE
jgi:nucleoside-diphosphate-sugar epimerase